MDAQAIVQITILATTISGFLFQAYQMRQKEKAEKRQREWDLEDRRLAREEQALARERIALKVEASALEVQKATDKQTETLVNKIDENTELSRVAFKEANSLNAKIAAVTSMFDGMKLGNGSLPQIQEVVEDTNARVRGITNADNKT